MCGVGWALVVVSVNPYGNVACFPTGKGKFGRVRSYGKPQGYSLWRYCAVGQVFNIFGPEKVVPPVPEAVGYVGTHGIE